MKPRRFRLESRRRSTFHSARSVVKRTTLPDPSAHTTGQNKDHISRLPFEILSYIFILARDSGPSSDDVYPLNLNALPWQLCRVSRRWREVAEATTALWRTVRVQTTREHLEALKNDHALFVQKASDALSRWMTFTLNPEKAALEGRVGLDVSFTATGNVSAVTVQSVDQLRYVQPALQIAMFTALLPYSNSWKTLRLVTNTHFLRHLHVIPKGRVSLLETLQIFLLGPHSWSPQFPLDAFEDAPRLRSLTVRGLPRSMWPHIKLPWHQIEELVCCETDSLDSFHAFQLATSVKQATVMSRTNPSSWLLSQRKHTTNTSLQSLAYHSFVGRLFQRPSEHLFRVVRFPALRELTLGASAEFGSLREAVNLVQHSGCRLEVLDVRRLYRAEIFEDDFKDLLECTENHLKSLTLHVSFISRVWTSIAEDTMTLLADKLADGSAARLEKIFLKLDLSSYRDAAGERAKLTNSRMVQRLSRVVQSGKLGLELCVHSEDSPTR